MSKGDSVYSYTGLNEVDAKPLITGHGLNKQDAAAYLEYLEFLAGKRKIEGLTRFDSFAVKAVNKEDIRELLMNEAGVTTDEDLLRQINRTYAGAIDVMENVIGLKIPEKIKGWPWKTVDSFIDFMFSSSIIKKTGGYLNVAKCAILKTMSAYNQIFDNAELVALEEHAKQFIETIYDMEGVHNKTRNDNEMIFDCFIKTPEGGTKLIKKIKIKFRIKERVKILMKLITNRKYTHHDQMSDLIGLSVETGGSETDIEDLMLHFSNNLVHLGCEMENKGAVSEDFSKRSGIPQRKKEKPDSTIERASTANGYMNACLYIKAETEQSLKSGKTPTVEIQFVPRGHNNDTGYRNHLILDAKKMITFIAREIGYCTADQLRRIVMGVVNEMGVEETKIPEQAKWIIRHLLTPEGNKEEGYLIRVYSENGHGPLFTTKDIMKDSSEISKHEKKSQGAVIYRPITQKDRISDITEAIYRAL